MYINAEKATEIEFKKAFDLIHFLCDDRSTVDYIFDFNNSFKKLIIKF